MYKMEAEGIRSFDGFTREARGFVPIYERRTWHLREDEKFSSQFWSA
jgi:hypothetical protein